MRPRPHIESLQLCPHGGPDYAELEDMGLAPEALLDFSVNFNPFGPPAGIRKALSTSPVHLYPDREATELRRCLAQKLKIAAENILVVNGSVELIRLAALAYFGPGDPVLIIEPTFGEYEVACHVAGAQPVKQWFKAEEGFRLAVDETVDLIQRQHPKGVFLCNPNNPTGNYLEEDELSRILAACEDSLLILDEAYIAFVDNAWSSLRMVQDGNLLVIRSMTKDYALAGLRLGYAIANQEIIEALRKVTPPWNVNAVAQQAGILALTEEGYLAKCKTGLKQARNFLVVELARLGLAPLPSRANFFLVKVGNAKKFRRALLERAILVRDCTSFGLPEYVRIAPRTLPECARLVTAIEDMGWKIDV